jgi:hypothetical protein
VGSKINDQEMYLYPNPVRDFLSIRNERMDYFSFRLYNVAGKLATYEPILSNGQEIDLTSLKPGVYFYQVWSAAGVEKSGKVIKE